MVASVSIEKQNEIDNRIDNDIRLRISLSYPKNSLLDIAKGLGAEVVFIKFPKDGKEISGAIRWENGTAKIYINEEYSLVRRTFTLAHELGHFLLHPSENKWRIDYFDHARTDQEAGQESEANYFAASLLMPKGEFVRIQKLTKDNTSMLAEYFGVSESAVEVRRKWIQTNQN